MWKKISFPEWKIILNSYGSDQEAWSLCFYPCIWFFDKITEQKHSRSNKSWYTDRKRWDEPPLNSKADHRIILPSIESGTPPKTKSKKAYYLVQHPVQWKRLKRISKIHSSHTYVWLLSDFFFRPDLIIPNLISPLKGNCICCNNIPSIRLCRRFGLELHQDLQRFSKLTISLQFRRNSSKN